MLAEDIIIRTYTPEDRVSVRRTCYEHNYLRTHVGSIWRDAQSFMDTFTLYYTDHEPESIRLAEYKGEVAGYLLGCLDSTKAFLPGEVMRGHVAKRGLFLRPSAARFVWRSLWDMLRWGKNAEAHFSDERWPSHMHITLHPHIYRKGAGKRLVENWLETLRAQGSPGIHLWTFEENTRAIAFFEAMGFQKHLEPIRSPGFRTNEGQWMHTRLMVQSLS